MLSQYHFALILLTSSANREQVTLCMCFFPLVERHRVNSNTCSRPADGALSLALAEAESLLRPTATAEFHVHIF